MSHVELKIRALLLEMDGYECKEPEPGKFTIAFGYVWTISHTYPAYILPCDQTTTPCGCQQQFESPKNQLMWMRIMWMRTCCSNSRRNHP